MKRLSILYNSSMFLLMLLLATSCKKTDLKVAQEHNSDIRSMGDFIRNNYDLSLLCAALKKTGLLDSLNGPGPFTIWAPDNTAYNGLGISRPEEFDSMNTDSLRYSLKYLLLPQRLYISDLPTQLDTKYVSMAGGVQYVSVLGIGANSDAFRVTINGCSLYDAPKRNIALLNGVMHLLNVMPKYNPETIQDFLAADTSLSIFVSLMKKTNQWDSLKLTGPYTVYAPVNDAFRQYQLTEDSIARIDLKRYKPIAFRIYTLSLEPHHLFAADLGMVGGDNPRITLSDGYEMAPSYQINIWAPGGRYNYHSPANIGYAGDKGKDNLVDNGVVFRIDNIMLYPDSLLIK